MTPADIAWTRRFNPMADNPLRTRADVSAALAALTAPLAAYRSPGGGRVRVAAGGAVFDQAAAELEGFVRPLWGLAAGARGGDDGGDWPAIARGLAAGTDPAHADHWGVPGQVDQRQVEAAAIGFALAFAGDRLLPELTAGERASVADWLSAARSHPVSDNNWHGFHAMMDAGLAALGRDPGIAASEDAFRAMDRFALDDGWYRDGATEQVDHYIAFGFHFYALVHLALGRATPERAAAIRDKASRFARDYAHWFAQDGAVLPLGRSQTYRFAVAGFWGALALAGVEALPWGVMKGLYLRQLRWWSTRPIATADGVLSIGHAYPNAFVAEDYSSPMSPYWAMKAFAPLALRADHPFWRAEEAPLPRPDRPVALAQPGLLIRHGADDTTALSSGQSNGRIRCGGEKCGKFAYSTRFGFSVEIDRTATDRVALDQMLGLIDAQGTLRVRTSVEDARIGNAMLWSRWRPWEDVTVETWLWWDGDWQMRAHRIDAPRPLATIEGAAAIGVPDDGGRVAQRTTAHGCLLTTTRDTVGIVDPAGTGRRAEAHRAEPNTNLLAPRTLIPRLRHDIAAGVTWLHTAILAGDAALAGAWTAPPAAMPVDRLQGSVASLTPVGAVRRASDPPIPPVASGRS